MIILGTLSLVSEFLIYSSPPSLFTLSTKTHQYFSKHQIHTYMVVMKNLQFPIKVKGGRSYVLYKKILTIYDSVSNTLNEIMHHMVSAQRSIMHNKL